MASLSNYLENALIDWLLRGFAFSVAGGSALAGSGIQSMYAGLLTALPDDTGGGVEVPFSGGYARVQITSTSNNWKSTQGTMGDASGGTGGSTTNGYNITFGAPTANWGEVVGIGMYDAPTGGNLLLYGALAAHRIIQSGDAPPSISPGFASFRLDT